MGDAFERDLMKVISRSGKFAILAFLLLSSCSSPGPKGCAAFPRELASLTNTVLTPLLSASVRHSRDEALRDGARPIPAALRSELEAVFPKETLDRVRWIVASDRVTLDTLVAAISPRHRAMTLDDTIVFLNEEDVNDIGLWTHELLHVEQIRRAGGVDRFSRIYLANWAEVEHATVLQNNEILAELNAPVRQPAPTLTTDCQSE